MKCDNDYLSQPSTTPPKQQILRHCQITLEIRVYPTLILTKNFLQKKLGEISPAPPQKIQTISISQEHFQLAQKFYFDIKPSFNPTRTTATMTTHFQMT